MSAVSVRMNRIMRDRGLGHASGLRIPGSAQRRKRFGPPTERLGLDPYRGFRLSCRAPQGRILDMLKQMAARLPATLQQELKRHYYAWQIRSGRFRTHEREFQRLDEFVSPGDWAIDVGA